MAKTLKQKAHDYAWEKTCDYFCRHDGYLNETQLRLYDVIKQTWLDGHNKLDLEQAMKKEKDQFIQIARYLGRIKRLMDEGDIKNTFMVNEFAGTANIHLSINTPIPLDEFHAAMEEGYTTDREK